MFTYVLKQPLATQVAAGLVSRSNIEGPRIAIEKISSRTGIIEVIDSDVWTGAERNDVAPGPCLTGGKMGAPDSSG